jgi:hypothetical protein
VGCDHSSEWDATHPFALPLILLGPLIQLFPHVQDEDVGAIRAPVLLGAGEREAAQHGQLRTVTTGEARPHICMSMSGLQ